MKINWTAEKIVFLIFLLISTLYLHRVPGLMGDEAHEGQNVYELVHGEGWDRFYVGERSYIGPAIDYIRLPFNLAFGYNALALRLPMLLASLVTFWLALSVFKKLFGEQRGLLVSVFVLISPIYLNMQRLGWGITLFPFFTILIIWLLQSKLRLKFLFAGAVAGLGLHNHILFAPVLAGLAAGAVLYWLIYSRVFNKKLFVDIGLAVSAFLVVMSSQLYVLQMQTSDQGDPTAVAELFAERLNDLPQTILPLFSGSSYVARYTGIEFSETVQLAIIVILLCLIVFGWWRSGNKKNILIWVASSVVVLLAMTYLIDRFALRYFTVIVLSWWVLAGVGLSEIMKMVFETTTRQDSGRVGQLASGELGAEGVSEIRIFVGSASIALLLTVIWAFLVLVPFLQTGGSVEDFSLGNRTNSAIDLASTKELAACLEGQGSVGSGNPHVYNRLLYFSFDNPALEVLPEEKLGEAKFEAHYRKGDATKIPPENQFCPDLKFFVVEQRQPAG